MSSPVKIDSLELENVKRVRAVRLEPSESGLTVIGGRNGQGKTSVLDALAWALGGERKRPTDAKRDGAATDPRLRVVLSNGIVVERKGKSGALKVTDPEGRKSGQRLLDSLVGELALDLPRFMGLSERDKARELLSIIGVGEELAALERREQQLYNQRTAIGQMRDQKRGAAEELPHHPDAPAEPVSASELIARQQDVLARNGENQRKRAMAAELERELEAKSRELDDLRRRAAEIERLVSEAAAEQNRLADDLDTARKTAEQLVDESTEELEEQIRAADEVNAKVRENAMRAAAIAEADELADQYREMTRQVEEARSAKMRLLQGADLPLPDLSVEDGALLYRGRHWDGMSGSEQLRVAAAIVRRLRPECGFVLVDKLEQMDLDTLSEFGAWCEAEGLQIIGTRVSTGGECSIVIEDGLAVGGSADSEPGSGAVEPIVEPYMQTNAREAAETAAAKRWEM